MSSILATYSAKDVNVALANSALGITIAAAGVAMVGLERLTIRMTTTHTVLAVSADGAVVPSAVPGDQGEVEIQCWQTSTLHQQLLSWYNLLKAARDAGDVSNWATSTMLIQNIVDGSQHVASGVSPQKVPDKVYGKEAQVVTWIVMACNIANN
jgi:hypothetical protein